MSGSQDEIPPPPPPPPSSSQTPTQQTPHIVSTIKLPILKKGEYDIWAMKMEHYLAHTDYPIWEVIQNGNGPISITTDTSGQIKVLPPRTAEEIVARERERKARTTLLMALPEDHLAKFHKTIDAKEIWDAIKSRLVGNTNQDDAEGYILKQQFEGFSVLQHSRTSQSYDRFQFLKSISVHGAGVSTEDANQKFLRSLPSAYCPQLDHEDLEQIDEYDLEEMDLKWQVAMISMRMKKFYKKTGRKLQFDAKEPVGFDKTKVECYNCHKTGHFARECRIKGNQDNRRRDAWNVGTKDGSRTGKKEDSKALVTIDGEGSDTEVPSCSTKCKEAYTNLKKLYDAQREQLSDASVEIKAYTQGLKKVEAQLVAHQQGQLCKMLNTQMSANDKFGLGYGDHRYDGTLSYENEVLPSVFMNKESELEKQPLYDRFVIEGGMHATQPSESESQISEFDTCDSNISTEPSELVSEPVMNESNVECQPKDWSDAPIIEINTARARSTNNVSTAKQSFNRHAILTSTAMKANTVKTTVNRVRPANVFHKTYSPFSRPFKKTTVLRTDFSKQKLNMLRVLSHSALRIKELLIVGCPVHMTENKAYLAEFQDFMGPCCIGWSKGIKREYSNARTPQQNGVAKRKNRTLIEAARTMLADSFLPNTFWAEVVSTACYVLNRMRVLVGYSLQSNAFRVYNLETKRVEENLHISFLENKSNVAGKGQTWLFDLDNLTDSMNYQPVRSENQANQHAGPQEANHNAGTEDIIDVGDSEKEDESAQDCFVLPIWSSYSSTITPDLKTDAKREGPREEEQVFLDELERLKRQEKDANKAAEVLRKEFAQETKNLIIQAGAAKASSTNIFSTVSTPAKASSTNLVNTVSTPVSTASPHDGLSLSDPTNPEQDDSEIPPLEDIYQNSTDGIFTNSSYDDEGAVADFTNLETVVNVSPIPTSRIISSHPSALILGDSFLGNAKRRPLWLLLLQRQNRLLLQAVVGKFCGFKIKC
ncbi:ribonuclease H-like domain-containing protein [Tanacetum coccineum]